MCKICLLEQHCCWSLLSRECDVSSFFEGKYHDMSKEERQHEFSVHFRWNRRKSYMMFLICQGYLQSAQVPNISNERMTCDILFDVEDVDRYICTFL